MSAPSASPLLAPNSMVPDQPAWDVARLFPNQGHWTEERYLALETNAIVELVDGFLVVHPMVSWSHALIVGYLFSQLQSFATSRKLGWVVSAPAAIRLRDRTYREPDVTFVSKQRASSLQQAPEGADLVMEVISPGAENRQRDYEDKRRDYAQAGVPEYWIVDPEAKTITVLTLEANKYREHGVFRPGDTATSMVLPGFTTSVDAVFQSGEETL